MLNKIERFVEQAKNNVARATRPLRSSLALEIAIRGAGALALVTSLPVFEARAQAAFPSWTLSVNGAPSGDGGMVPFTLTSTPGNTVEVIGGPMSYEDITGKQFDFPGQENGEDRASVVIIDGGTPGIELVAWSGGNWYGVTPNPNGEVDLSTPNEEILASDANRSLRDPNLGNGKGKDGVQGTIDYAKIWGPTGVIQEVGTIAPDGTLVLEYDIDGHQGPTTQPQSQSTEPGFVN